MVKDLGAICWSCWSLPVSLTACILMCSPALLLLRDVSLHIQPWKFAINVTQFFFLPWLNMVLCGNQGDTKVASYFERVLHPPQVTLHEWARGGHWPKAIENAFHSSEGASPLSIILIQMMFCWRIKAKSEPDEGVMKREAELYAQCASINVNSYRGSIRKTPSLLLPAGPVRIRQHPLHLSNAGQCFLQARSD